MQIREIANDRPRLGCERIHVTLRREGWQINLKRVHRLYCPKDLQVRMCRRRKKHKSFIGVCLHQQPDQMSAGSSNYRS
jgi:putative transposase